MAFSLSALVHPGAEASAMQEVKEILGVESQSFHSFITFSVKSQEEVLQYLARAQLSRRVLFFLGIFFTPGEVVMPKFPWKEIFSSETTYGIELEHISGQEPRQKLMKKLGEEIVAAVKKETSVAPKFTFKKPEVLLVLHCTGKEYVLGIDLAGEMQKRAYRIFTHHASFTGDLGFFLIKKSGFFCKEKILVGWVKDGTLAIEAALYANQLVVHKAPFACEKFPLFQGVSSSTVHQLQLTTHPPPVTPIFAFDVSMQNITAARKNAKLAGVYEMIDFQKYSLEELDVKYGEASFDRIIFHLTVKDEPKLNELYYQMKYILKPKGTVLLVTRKQLDLPVPEGFTLISEEELKRGESVQKIWILKKNSS